MSLENGMANFNPDWGEEVRCGDTCSDPDELIENCWYVIGVKNLDGDIDWGGCNIAKYIKHDNEGLFVDEDGYPDQAWDSVSEMMIPSIIADEFMFQNKDSSCL